MNFKVNHLGVPENPKRLFRRMFTLTSVQRNPRKEGGLHSCGEKLTSSAYFASCFGKNTKQMLGVR